MANKKSPANKQGELLKATVFLGREGGTADGKRLYKQLYAKTQTELDGKVMDTKTKLGKGYDLSSQNKTFGYYAGLWLSDKKVSVAAKQLKNLKSCVDHLNQAFKDVDITSIKKTDVKAVINALTEKNPHTGKPSSKRTLKAVLSTAEGIFELAIDNRLFDYNPASKIKLSDNAPVEERKALQKADRPRIKDTPHRAQLAAMLMMYAGLRKGELIPLLWSDIDFKARTINVNKSVAAYKSNVYTIKPGAKTDAGIRTIPIVEDLFDFLVAVPKESMLVITQVCGKMHTPTSFRQLWKSYMVEMNLKYGTFIKRNKSKFDPSGVPMAIATFTAHQLRHTFATMLAEAGVPPAVMAKLLGHAKVQTSLDIYTHIDYDDIEKGVVQFNVFLKKAG